MPFVISETNIRVTDADTETNGSWVNIGGGQSSSLEGSFFYQGNALSNRKLTASTGNSGFAFEPSATIDATNNHAFILKFNVSDYGGLQASDGIRFFLGQSVNQSKIYTVAGSNAIKPQFSSYPSKGGFILVAIDPNVLNLNDDIAGNPTINDIGFIGIACRFVNSTAKSENVGLDAIDYGLGLTLTGTDTSPSTFSEFLNYDEGIIANRFGYVTKTGGVINCVGTMQIGDSLNITEYEDDVTLIWSDGFVSAGFNQLILDATQSLTSIKLFNNIESLGTANISDTRLDITTLGSLGSIEISSSLKNIRNISLSPSANIYSSNISSNQLTINGATISNSTFNCPDGSVYITDFSSNDANIISCQFNIGDNGTICEITEADTTLNFTGHSINGSSARAIINSSGGALTINVTDGDAPTVENLNGSTTTILNTINIKVKCIDINGNGIANSRVFIKTDTGGPESVNTVIINDLTDSNGEVSVNRNFISNQPIIGRARKSTTSPLYKTSIISGTITNSGYNSIITMVSDES